jgi:hypothetical protein
MAGRSVAERIGTDVGDVLGQKLQSLYELIRNKLKGDAYASESMKRLEEKPDSPDRRAAATGVLKEALAADPQFLAMLEKLLSESKAAGASSVIQVSGSGSAAIQGGVAAGQGGISAGRDVVFGAPRSRKNDAEE